MTAAQRQPCWPATITVPGLPPSPNRRMAWQARRRLVRPLVDAVVLQARALRLPQPLERAHVVATLVHQRGPLRDWDNSVASLKEIVDALITGGLIVSDAPGHLELKVVQVFGPQRAVVLEVFPAEYVGDNEMRPPRRSRPCNGPTPKGD